MISDLFYIECKLNLILLLSYAHNEKYTLKNFLGKVLFYWQA